MTDPAMVPMRRQRACTRPNSAQHLKRSIGTTKRIAPKSTGSLDACASATHFFRKGKQGSLVVHVLGGHQRHSVHRYLPSVNQQLRRCFSPTPPPTPERWLQSRIAVDGGVTVYWSKRRVPLQEQAATWQSHGTSAMLQVCPIHRHSCLTWVKNRSLLATLSLSGGEGRHRATMRSTKESISSSVSGAIALHWLTDAKPVFSRRCIENHFRAFNLYSDNGKIPQAIPGDKGDRNFSYKPKLSGLSPGDSEAVHPEATQRRV